jgi:hypothetical protein
MISTKASAVKAPTPGCVINRFASGHFSTSCSIAWLNSAIRRVQSIHQLQQIAPSPTGPRCQAKCFQLLPPVLPPQPLLAAQAFVQRHRLQLVHDSRARLHHAVPVPQQLPQIPVLPARHPDLRKIILQHEFQNQLRVLPIRLLLADSSGSDFCRISDPEFNLQLGQQSFEPAPVPTGFHPYTNLLPCGRELAIEPLRFLAMS